MTSTFGWLDTDPEQRRRMLEVVDLFKEESTVDELGIGTIRDGIAEALFPGTSVLQTRVRYFLFIPWLLQRASHKATPQEMSAEFRSTQYRLTESLLAGGETTGVFGRFARRKLKRMASDAYWPALGAWEVIPAGMSSDGFFRRQRDYRQLAKRTATADDPEAREILPGTGLDPHLPNPPDGLLEAADFALTAGEEDYLSQKITEATEGTLLAWLVQQPPSAAAEYAWEINSLSQAPEQMRELVDHARRFHVAIYGAPLLYNLLLAQKSHRDELADEYRERLDLWRTELRSQHAMDGWSRTDWWATIQRCNPRLRPMTRQFVDRWLDLAEEDVDPATSRAARDLVATRERQIKGGRARLVNQSALDRWSGSSGLGRLDYRWSIAQRHLNDLYRAREAS